MKETYKPRLLRRHKTEEWIGRGYTVLCVLFLLVIILSIVYFVAAKGISAFTMDSVSLSEFLLGTRWNPDDEKFGALPFIYGSFLTSLLAALIATPLSICAALLMTEIVPGLGKKWLQPVIELLSGIPSVIYGFIGLTLLVPLLRDMFPGQGVGAAAGAAVLSLMILPTITSIASDALSALPRNLREASYGLGATRWQTIYGVILPAVLPSMMTGVVLGIARAFGEALAVQMVIGNAPHIPNSLFESASTLTSVITLNMSNTVMGSVQNNVLWSLALILLLMTFVFVLAVRMLERRSFR